MLAPYSSDPRFFTATMTKIYFYDVATGTNTEVHPDWERSMGFDFEITSDGFIAFLADGVYSKRRVIRGMVQRGRVNGSAGSRRGNSFSFALYEEMIFVGQRIQPGEHAFAVVGAARRGESQRQRAIHWSDPHFKGRTIAKTEVLHSKGANDDDVEGVLTTR